MLPRIAVALLLALGTAQAAEPIAMLRGESVGSFQCRSTWIPPARQCMARCDAAPASAGGESDRFDCIQACTAEGLRAIGSCRQAAGAQAVLASR
jgi:hypothetical protein